MNSKKSDRKVVMALSGGLDSATLLGYFLFHNYQVTLVNFQYNSKHNVYERSAAREIAKYYNQDLLEIDASNLFKFTKSNLLIEGGEIPEGHYHQENMRQTVVPGRNLIFLSTLASIAESKNIDSIGIGVHQGDHHIYPDCRVEFIGSATETIIHSTDGKVNKILTPFMFSTKSDIVAIAIKFSVPIRLTRTCYKEQTVACGKCGSCQERLEAFENNNYIDPVQYEKR